jgi:Spy/CpxP family protein refolding chaperone
MANHRTNKIKLTRAEKQQLKSLMARNRQKGKKGSYSAQDTIPY